MTRDCLNAPRLYPLLMPIRTLLFSHATRDPGHPSHLIRSYFLLVHRHHDPLGYPPSPTIAMNRFSAGCTRLRNRFYRSGQPSRPVNAVAKKCSTANCNNWAVTGKSHCTTHGG